VTALEELAALLEDLERDGTTVMALARGGRPLEPWVLYPGEYGIFDRKTRCQFYYHAHAGATHEEGHFHTVRLFPDRTAHLVGISMAPRGWPLALFTVNRWAVGDADEPAAALKRYARQFQIGRGRGPVRLVRFINLMFRAFRAEIEQALEERERCLETYRSTHPGRDPSEDRSLEVLSRVEIDVRARLAPSDGG
jgi:hypothetical protein